MRRRLAITRLACVLVAGLVALAGSLAGCGGDDADKGPDGPPTPRVTGLTLAKAERLLERAGATWVFDGDGKVFKTVGESSARANRRLAGRRVVSQDPRAGTPTQESVPVLLGLRPRL
jgi:hypothetical protein